MGDWLRRLGPGGRGRGAAAYLCVPYHAAVNRGRMASWRPRHCLLSFSIVRAELQTRTDHTTTNLRGLWRRTPQEHYRNQEERETEVISIKSPGLITLG